VRHFIWGGRPNSTAELCRADGHRGHERSCRQRVSVLECGDEVFEVAALVGVAVSAAPLAILSAASQSGDSEDSVTAVQNLAADSTVHRERDAFPCPAGATVIVLLIKDYQFEIPFLRYLRYLLLT
jgi:hypothetical protein